MVGQDTYTYICLNQLDILKTVRVTQYFNRLTLVWYPNRLIMRAVDQTSSL